MLLLSFGIFFPSYTSNISIFVNNEPADFLITFAISSDDIFLSINIAKSLLISGYFDISLNFIFPVFLASNLSKFISKTYTFSFSSVGCTFPIIPTMSLLTDISAV